MNNLLKHKDPKLYNLIKLEYIRQKYSLELIASENFNSLMMMNFYNLI